MPVGIRGAVCGHVQENFIGHYKGWHVSSSYSVPGPLLGARDIRKKKAPVPTLMALIITAWTGFMTLVMVIVLY